MNGKTVGLRDETANPTYEEAAAFPVEAPQGKNGKGAFDSADCTGKLLIDWHKKWSTQ